MTDRRRWRSTHSNEITYRYHPVIGVVIRASILCLLLATAVAAPAAEITFLSPLGGSQAVGVLPIEVSTSIANINRVEFFVDGTLVGAAKAPPWRILHDFGTSDAARAVTARVSASSYRVTASATVLTAALSAGETMNVDLVEVPMRVRATRPPRASDLRLREGKVEQTIRDVRADRGPARFVFIVDRSLSMGEGRLVAALDAIDREANQLRADDRVEILFFNQNVQPIRPVARGERVSATFRNLAASGGTSLRDAIASIASSVRTYAFAITDGGDRNSLIDEETALRRVSGTKVVIDAIVLGGDTSFLERIALTTGGTVARANTETLRGDLHRMLMDINSRYTVVYQSHGNGSGWRSIAISSRRRELEILNARKGYFAQ